MPKISNQTGRILDAISHGPIEGLVGGKTGVFLDDSAVQTKVIDPTVDTETINTTANITQGSNIIEVPTDARMNKLATANLTVYPRFIWVEEAGREVNITSYGGAQPVYRAEEGGGFGSLGSSQTLVQYTPILSPGDSRGKVIGTVPLVSNSKFFKQTLEEQNRMLALDEHKIFLRETIDLQKFYFTGTTVTKQTSNSQIKQTFTASCRAANASGWGEYNNTNSTSKIQNHDVTVDFDRKHFFTEISEFLGTTTAYINVAGYSGTTTYSKNSDNNLLDAILDNRISIGGNADDFGTIGILGNEGEYPGVGQAGNPETDRIKFDGVYKILYVQSSSKPGVTNLVVDTSTGPDFIPRPPAKTAINRRAHIFTTEGPGAIVQNKFRGSVEFKNGTRYQSAIANTEGNTTPPRTNVIINPATTLLWGNSFAGSAKRDPDDDENVDYSGTSAPTIYSSSGSSPSSLGLSALQTRQIDAIRLNIIFPNGLYAVTKKGDYIDAHFDASIVFRHRRTLTQDFKQETIRGVIPAGTWWTDSDGGYSANWGTGSGLHIKENKKAVFSREIEIDVTAFHPFTDFEIEIVRNTPDKFDDYMLGDRIEDEGDNQVKSFVGGAVVQYVQALFFDKFKYPNTAYAAVTFSGADFDKVPARGYHCRGLKVRVPSNYITREEDALLTGTGTGVARYSRSPTDVFVDTSTISIAEKKLLVNQVSFTLVPGDLEIGETYDGIGYFTGKEAPSSTHPPGTIDSGYADLIEAIYFQDDNGDASGDNDNLYIRFQEDYSLYGANIRLANHVTSVTVSLAGTTLVYDVVDSFISNSGKTIGVELSRSDASKSLTIQNGISYSIKVKFSDSIVRPNDYVVWDGNFREEVYTNNPAWVFLDVLLNKEYGLGDFIKIEDVDIYELYQIARYCDELVPDGKGGLEPRFACNVYISKSTEAYKLVKDLASTFRGMTTWQNSQVHPIQDRPKESVYLFSRANVIDGAFSYERTGLRAKPNSIECTWNDPDQQFRQDVFVLDDTEAQLKAGKVVSKKIAAFGCTSKQQAKRVAEWHLITNQQESKIVSFKTSINSSFLKVGDIISIQDPYTRARLGDSGRIKSAIQADSSTPTVELDRQVTLDSTKDYLILIQITDSVFILQQDFAVIGGISYTRGQSIEFSAEPDKDSLVSNTKRADQIVDDNNNLVKVEKTDKVSIVKKEIIHTGTGTGTTTEYKTDHIALSSSITILDSYDPLTTFDSTRSQAGKNLVDEGTPNPNTINKYLENNIWAITENVVESDTENFSLEKYRIMTMKKDRDQHSVEISGVLYDESKFNIVDVKNTSFSDPVYDSARAATIVPAPVNGNAAAVISGGGV